MTYRVGELMHNTYKVPMIIDEPGVAAFQRHMMTSDEIAAIIPMGKSDRFRNPSFKRFPVGTKLLVTFRVSASSKRRSFISAFEADDVAWKMPGKKSIASESTFSIKPDLTSKLSVEAIEATKTALEESIKKAKTVFDKGGTITIDPTAPVTLPPVFEEDLDLSSVLTLNGEQISPSSKKPRLLNPDKPKPFSAEDTERFFISEAANRVFTQASTLMQAYPTQAVKIMIVGPSGYGKTSIARLYANSNRMNFMRMNCASVRDPEEWFGYREARDGSTVFIPSPFIRMVQEGNCVVCFDEYNRAEPDIHNTLFPLLDDDQKTNIHGEDFAVGPNVVFIGTINRGHQYTGTFELDEANLNRFDMVLEVEPLNEAQEIKILLAAYPKLPERKVIKIVSLANLIRQSISTVHCSIRTTKFIARSVSAGTTIKEAYLTALLHRAERSDDGRISKRKELVDLININSNEL